MEAEDENEAMANPLHALSRAKTFYVLPTKKKKNIALSKFSRRTNFFIAPLHLHTLYFSAYITIQGDLRLRLDGAKMENKHIPFSTLPQEEVLRIVVFSP